METFPANRGAVLIYENGAGREPTCHCGTPAELERRQPHRPSWSHFAPDRHAHRACIRHRQLAGDSVTSVIAAPLVARGDVAAVLYLSGSDLRRFLDDQHLELLVATAGLAAVAWENVQYIEWLESEHERLNDELGLQHDMIGNSPRMAELNRFVVNAPTASTVLIQGESGTGKELIARAIHRNSPRPNKLSSPSIAPQSPRRCWKASYSAMKRAPSPARPQEDRQDRTARRRHGLPGRDR